MVFHSHNVITDEKTGIVHNLCCYKECVINDEKTKDDDIIVNTTSRDCLTKSQTKPLLSYNKDEIILDKPTSRYIIENEDCPEPLEIQKKPPQRKGPKFKLKLSSDIVSKSYRKKHKAYKAAMLNSTSSDYLSDEFIEMDTDTESIDNDSNVNSSTNSVSRKASEEMSYDEKCEEECVEIDSTEFSSTKDYNMHDDNMTYSSISSKIKDNFNPRIIDTNSQQNSNSESIESFHKAIEDARSAMISLIDKFQFERRSESQSSQENSNKVSRKGSQGELVPVGISKSNIINTDKISSKKKKKDRKVQSRFGTSESPIDLDDDRSQVVPIVLIEDTMKSKKNSLESKVKSVQNQDNMMINWFDRDDFRKFMLDSAKRRLETLDDVMYSSKKYVKVEKFPTSRLRGSYAYLDNQNDCIESPIVQIPEIPIFKNQDYLKLALTHNSVHSNRQNYVDDESLEIFEVFGDCILSTTISQMAYEKFKDQLTPNLLEKIHIYLCSNYSLCQFAKMLKLQDLIYARKPFLSIKEVAKIFVALLAAIIMDSGREIVVDFIRKLIGPTMDQLVRNGNFVGKQINDTNEKIPIKNVVND
ncbi:hypothetical protein C1645_808337 [Glomus cerebriforme]|uniref:RNase III domain-containing protein n=1 Tax=Glomus cerebriforme TaxID=658196 RepID=A0A397SGI3_9GLOM|nr:hypothetical protein C1645_808337 [Glomus cerebriforme]